MYYAVVATLDVSGRLQRQIGHCVREWPGTLPPLKFSETTAFCCYASCIGSKQHLKNLKFQVIGTLDSGMSPVMQSIIAGRQQLRGTRCIEMMANSKSAWGPSQGSVLGVPVEKCVHVAAGL